MFGNRIVRDVIKFGFYDWNKNTQNGIKKKSKENPLSKGFFQKENMVKNGHKYMDSYNNQNAFILFYNNKLKKRTIKRRRVIFYSEHKIIWTRRVTNV